MKGKNKVSAIFATLLLIIGTLVVIQFPVPIYANPEDVEVKVGSATPATYIFPNQTIGDTVTMPIMVRNLTNPGIQVVSWQANVDFTAKILNCTTIMNGTFLAGKYNSTTHTYKWNTSISFDTPDNVNGHITNIKGNITTVGGSVALNGSSVLAYLVFTVKSFGSAAVSITSIYMQDNLANPIDVTTVDGSFGMAMLVSLPSVSWTYPADGNIGDTVTMDLIINASTDTTWGGVTFWQADFSFNSSILQCNSVTEGTYLSSVDGTVFKNGTVGSGTITSVNCTLTTGSANGSGVLAHLNFKVLDFGTTAVSITSIAVTVGDPHSGLVSTVNGSFTMGLKVSLPSTSWTYNAGNIGDPVTIDMEITAPSLASWKGGITSWKANFSYDPEILDITSVTEGTFLSKAGATTFINGTADHVNGTITNVSCSLNDPTKNATGTGAAEVMASLTFNVTGAGSTKITITGLTLIGTSGIIPVTTADGYFELGAKMELVPSMYNLNGVNIGDKFQMNITITTAELSAWQAGLKFDATTVNVINITLGRGFWNTSTTDVFPDYVINTTTTLPDGITPYIDNTAGTVQPFGETQLGNVSAPETGPDGKVLATIWFNVTGYVPTVIQLTGAKAFGSEIPLTLKYAIVMKMGDVDSNGVVNILDVGTVCAVYALPLTPEEKAAAYPLCDVDSSGTVNILDVGTVCSIYALGG